MPSAIARDALDLVDRSGDPARIARRDLLDPARRAVLVLEAMQHDVELQHADGADDRRRSRRLGAGREEHLRRALFGELAQTGVELLPLHRIGQDDAREMLRREARNAAELQVGLGRQRVADAKRAAVHDADDVARPRFLDRRALARQELLRRRAAESILPVRTCFTCMPASNRPEQMRTNATRSRCFASMFAWILNTNPVNCSSVGSNETGRSIRAAPARGASSRNSRRNGSTPKFVSALPKNTGDSSPESTAASSNGCPASSSSEMSCTRRSCDSGAEQLAKLRVLDRPDLHLGAARAVILGPLEQVDELAPAIVHADERAVLVDRPRDGMTRESRGRPRRRSRA